MNFIAHHVRSTFYGLAFALAVGTIWLAASAEAGARRSPADFDRVNPVASVTADRDRGVAWIADSIDTDR